MILIRLITNSDRVVFMILWVVGMFAISVYLISVEYLDDSIRKTLEDVSDREADFGVLLPDSEQVREKVQTRLQEKHEEIHSHIQEKHEEIHAHYMEHRREKAPESEDEE
jgi:vacuolar-type H+-ATPase subunit I/STV1